MAAADTAFVEVSAVAATLETSAAAADISPLSD